MSKRPAPDRLSALAQLLPPREADAEAPVDELDRIMALPLRPPVNCDPDASGRYAPATQALIEHVTAQLSRGLRVTCGCAPRRVTMVAPGLLAIARLLPPDVPPEPPALVTVDAVANDSRYHRAEWDDAQRMGNLRAGETIELPSVDGSVKPCITQLNAQQAWTLYEAPITGGAVMFATVGSGKTVTNLLLPLLFPDASLAVLCIEPKQRLHYKHHYLRLREHFRVGTVVLDDNTVGFQGTVPGTVPTHLLSYSILSRTENSDKLDRLDPDVLILDEAHRACGDSAINRRVKRFIHGKIERREQKIAAGLPVRTRAVNLFPGSGTLENKSVQDTQMLCTYSLGKGSPLPLDPDIAVAWSAVMDATRKPDRVSTTAKRLQRVFAGREYEPVNVAETFFDAPEKDVRRGFQRRRSHTLGIITANAVTVGASIYITERVAPKMPDVVREALTVIRRDKLRPDGEEATERLHQVEWAREILCGFYRYWAFPKHVCACGGVEPRCPNCLHIDDWFRKRKAYNKELRAKLQQGELHLDTDKLCRQAAERFWQEPPYQGELPTWACESWPAWRDIENTIEYVEKTRWLGCSCVSTEKCRCDPATHPGFYLARDAAEWATSNKGVIWFQSVPLGRKIAELADIPYFNGGPGCEQRMAAEKGDRSIVCSIKALGAGTDGLQHKFHKQLIVEPPASNGGQEGMEQLLGRLHRQGQRADVVETYVYLHASELVDALRQVELQAEFSQDMQRRPRFLMADRDFEL